MLKQEQELNQAGSSLIRGGISVDPLDYPTPRAPKPLSPVWDQRDEEGEHVEIDLTKQLSTEDSELGGSGEKKKLLFF